MMTPQERYLALMSEADALEGKAGDLESFGNDGAEVALMKRKEADIVRRQAKAVKDDLDTRRGDAEKRGAAIRAKMAKAVDAVPVVRQEALAALLGVFDDEEWALSVLNPQWHRRKIPGDPNAPQPITVAQQALRDEYEKLSAQYGEVGQELRALGVRPEEIQLPVEMPRIIESERPAPMQYSERKAGEHTRREAEKQLKAMAGPEPVAVQ